MNAQAARSPASVTLHPERQPECAKPHARQLPGPVLIQRDDLWHGPTLKIVTPSRLVLDVSAGRVTYSDRHGRRCECALQTFRTWTGKAGVRLMARARV